MHKMTVAIRQSDPAADVRIDVMGWGQSLDGVASELRAPDDTSPYSAREYITIEPQSFHLEPGDSREVSATIDVPQDSDAGGRYAIINVHTLPTGEGQIGVSSAINGLVLLTVKDSQLVHQCGITELATSEAVSGQPVDIFTTLQNTGNHHFKVRGDVRVADGNGETLDIIHIPLTPSSVIPTMSRQLKASFIPQGELPLGVYSVKSVVMLEDGTVLDEAVGSFEVKEPYVPPPPPASATVSPSSAATLRTEDGSISVSFPQGAVVSQADISVRYYPLEQIPAPPSGYRMATTCFRIDGLTGLLAKEATVTVKYSDADLDKAEEDASRLRLARWDEAGSRWTILDTKLDKGNMTLSTKTDRFSIWAVMVGSPSGGTSSLVIIIAVAAAVVLIGAPAYLFLLRNRRLSRG